MNIKINTRVEKDLLGHKEIPVHCYYGVQTLRALENFNLSPNKLNQFPVFINALAMVKAACAEANFKLNKLEENKYNAIQYACEQIINYKYHDQFPIDMIQGGAGTSTNMNINEVLANIGLEHLDHLKGEYQYLHPNNDINMSQSTNDVYPTAIKVGLIFAIEQLNSPFQNLIQSFKNKSDEFSHILKMGRTQLQDAVPMTLGQEFGTFANTLQNDLNKLNDIMPSALSVVNLGGTAIGTGINTEVKYREYAIAALSEITQKQISSSPDLIEATSDMGDFVLLSSFLKRTATKLSKIANDLRLLSSGPRTGLNEIHLEPRQPGSSIMPGKVNPVIPEAMNFVLPLGYSFNLDGSMMYMAFAVLFIAQAYNIDLSFSQQALILFTLMITSKGIAGVSRASIVVIASTLAMFQLPEAGILLILAIDQFLDMGRTATNVIGNSIATAVIARTEGNKDESTEQEGIMVNNISPANQLADNT
jgi:aspartate ammonia-lyase